MEEPEEVKVEVEVSFVKAVCLIKTSRILLREKLYPQLSFRMEA